MPPAVCACRRSLPQESWLDRPPLPIVRLKQLIGLYWAPCTRRIIWKLSRRQRSPHVQHWIDHAPSRLDHIRALEKRRIPDHAVVKQHLITGVGVGPKILRVFEV